MTPLDRLLYLNGPLGGSVGDVTAPQRGDGGALLLHHVLSLWGRQLLLALQVSSHDLPCSLMSSHDLP